MSLLMHVSLHYAYFVVHIYSYTYRRSIVLLQMQTVCEFILMPAFTKLMQKKLSSQNARYLEMTNAYNVYCPVCKGNA